MIKNGTQTWEWMQLLLPPKCICRGNTLSIDLNSFILHFNNVSTGVLNIVNCFGLSKQVTQVNGIKRDKPLVKQAVRKTPGKGENRIKHVISVKKTHPEKSLNFI